MDLKKFSPWNWFRSENGNETLPVQRESWPAPMFGLSRDFERFMSEALRSFNMPSVFDEKTAESMLLRPNVDIAERENAYAITVEVPGVNENDLKLSFDNHRLIIEGEKKHESEDKRENYHRIERSYGSFRRVLDLPEDAQSENIKAAFKDGVLTITVPRSAEALSSRRQIAIQKE